MKPVTYALQPVTCFLGARVRQRIAGVLCVSAAMATLASCGGGGGGTPTAPLATPVSITITSTGTHLFLGRTETFTATLVMSNGTSQPLTSGLWSSDATPVATVVGTSGVVTSVSSGDVTIAVDGQGLRGTKRITVVPDYRGIWFGNYIVNSCAQTLEFIAANLCGEFTVGRSLPISFNLDQTATSVTGRTAIGQLISAFFTVLAAPTGGLTFPVSAAIGTTMIAQAWDIRITTVGRIDGTFVQTWTDSITTGNLVVGSTLQDVIIPGDGIAAMPTARSARTLREVADVVTRRR